MSKIWLTQNDNGENMAKKNSYSADDIRAQSGLEVIQENISMYAGGSGSDGIFTLVREPGDNGVDEALAGRNDYVRIKLSGSYSKNAFIPSLVHVIDRGNGIPVEKPKGEKRTALEIVTSHVHGGGKFKGSDSYGDGSRGTHGVGLKLCTALSSYFNVYTCWKKKWHLIQYVNAKMVTETRPMTKSELNELFKKVGKLDKGTVIEFSPKMSYFDKGSSLSIADVKNWCQLSAYFNSGVETIVEYPDSKGKEVSVPFYYEDGISAYLNDRISSLKLNLLEEDFVSATTAHIDLALAFTDGDTASIEGYTNTLYNSNGGTHLEELYNCLAKSLEPYRGKNVYNKNDIREGLLGIINFKVPGPKFASQTKERLSDARVYDVATPIIQEVLDDYFKKHKNLAKQICERAANLRKLKSEFAMTKKAAQELKPKKNGGALLPGKLAEVRGCDPAVREIFLVEGDSAGGCFLGSTPVRLSDGSSLTFEQLVECSRNGIKSYGIAFDTANQCEVEVLLEDPRITKVVDELIEVELSDGSLVVCTPDHLWMVDGGEYVSAQNLEEGTILQSSSSTKNL